MASRWVFASRRARAIAMLNLLRRSDVDGAFGIEERRLLRDVAAAFGVAGGEFRLMDNRMPRLVALEQEAGAIVSV